MLRQKFVVIVSLGIFSVAAVGMGQDASQSPATNQKPQKSISIFGQLDQFGKKLVSGIFPDKSADSEKNSSPSMSSRFRRGPMQGEFNKGRAGSVLDAKEKSPSVGKTVAVTKGLSEEIAGQKNSPATAGMAVEKRAAVVRRSQPQSREVADAPLPLHQRLMGLSRSSFGNNKPSKSGGEDKDVAAIINQNLAKPKPTIAQAPARSAKTTATVKREAGAKPTLARRPTSTRSAIAARPTIAKGPVAGGTTTKKAPAKKAASVPTLAKRLDTRQPAAKKSVAKSKASGSVLVESRVSGERGENVLFDRRSPMLHVRTMGPRQITVGKESTYTVFIDNLGKAEAADVAVVIELPQSAEILGADPSQGVTRRPRAVGDRARFDWQVGNLAAGGSEEIALRIVPRESSPIDLGVSWNFKPTVLQAKIEVQEPKLEIKLNGPREAAFGKCQKYKLEIANNGTGVAEDVGITIMPVTPGKGMPSTHRLGVFPAGKKMSLEIALTPRQKDDLAVRVDLQNEGKVCARLDEKILVRKAELEMVAEGPDMQYVGTVATYRIRLRNTGNADAKGLNVAANIPAQAKYLASDNDGKLLEGGKAVWKLESLAAGDEKIIEIKCELIRSGFNRIDVETTAAEEIQVSTAVGTNVEAMADLALNVVDPTGPVPVGNEAVYQMRIRNRGSKRAENVEAVAYFSQGIEPISASGAAHTLGPGQVLFRNIGTLEAGKEVLIKIAARADTPGNHMFRAEVYCKPLNTKLVSEETTHFFNGTLVADRPTIRHQTADRLRSGRAALKSVPQKTVVKESRIADRRDPWGGLTAPTDSPDRSSDGKTSPTVAPRYRLEQR